MFLNRVLGYGRWPRARGVMIILVRSVVEMTSYNSRMGWGSEVICLSRSYSMTQSTTGEGAEGEHSIMIVPVLYVIIDPFRN